MSYLLRAELAGLSDDEALKKAEEHLALVRTLYRNAYSEFLETERVVLELRNKVFKPAFCVAVPTGDDL